MNSTRRAWLRFRFRRPLFQSSISCVYNVCTNRGGAMARELTIQIRLTKQEHATIAAQAEKEGLGVGTYLRALALRTALAALPSSRGRAFAALRRTQERAKVR